MKYTPFSILDELLVMPRAGLVLLLACLGALATAFVAQYTFDKNPCILCLWQRIPFAITIALAGCTLLARDNHELTRKLLLVIALVMFVDTCLAFYHTGVELHWWAATNGCAVQSLSHADSVESLREALLNTSVARCDQISWTLFGFSMANWNVPFTASLGLFALMAAHGVKTGRRLFACRKEDHLKPVL